MIRNSDLGRLDEVSPTTSDLHLCALGFESRCLELLKRELIETSRYVFLEFPETDLFEFHRNKLLAGSLPAATFLSSRDPSLTSNLQSEIERHCPKCVSVDISSMNRQMIASLFLALSRIDGIDDIIVHYVPAEFQKPNLLFSEIESAGPVLPEFSGFDTDISLPSSMILGLGFEYGVAVGLISRLEPRSAICLYATGHDTRFETAVRKANLGFRFPGSNASAIGYDLFDPEGTYHFVASSIRNLEANFRVSCIPMGPKILSVVFTLACLEHLGSVSMWRIVRKSLVADSKADGLLSSFQVDARNLHRAGLKWSSVEQM